MCDRRAKANAELLVREDCTAAGLRIPVWRVLRPIQPRGNLVHQRLFPGRILVLQSHMCIHISFRCYHGKAHEECMFV